MKEPPPEYDQFYDFLHRYYFRLEQPSFAQSYRFVARDALEAGWAMPSMSTARRHINNAPKEMHNARKHR